MGVPTARETAKSSRSTNVDLERAELKQSTLATTERS